MLRRIVPNGQSALAARSDAKEKTETQGAQRRSGRSYGQQGLTAEEENDRWWRQTTRANPYYAVGLSKAEWWWLSKDERWWVEELRSGHLRKEVKRAEVRDVFKTGKLMCVGMIFESEVALT